MDRAYTLVCIFMVGCLILCLQLLHFFSANGQSIVIRTCSMNDWGTVCGSVLFEHGSESNKEKITGCLETCNFDGCNTATSLQPQSGLALALLSTLIFYCYTR